jgi:hypothetical protein
LGEGATAQVQLLSAIEVAQESRYIDVAVEVTAEGISEDGRYAHVEGEIRYPPGEKPAPSPTTEASATEASTTLTPQASALIEPPGAQTVWLAVIAYDEHGSVVGVRKWEGSKELKPGKHLSFALEVYSSGPPIAKVEYLVEARP